MTDKHFPILGGTIPPMIGRTDIMRRLFNDLTKTTPSHLSIVGPRFSGKTVVMNGLAERMRQERSPYHSVIYWDLGHQTPVSNDDFLKTLCRKIGEGLKSAGNEYGDHLLHVENEEYSELRDVLEFLHDDGIKVLMLWDGFDKPLGSGKLTRNLWDQLRELASNPSLRLATATRRPLRELIRNEESVTSDFWNIFDMSPVRVGAFDENDRNTILNIIDVLSFTNGAKTELENWSAAFPPLYLALLNQLITRVKTGEVDNLLVNEVAESTLECVDSILHDLWDDCPETAKDIYRHLIEKNEKEASSVCSPDRDFLKEKGFINVTGNKVTKGCRLLEDFIKNRGHGSGSLEHIFGTYEEYQRNIRGFLELRLSQIHRFDDRLPRYVEFAIKRLPGDPDLALNDLTSIEERALDLIWQREFGSDKTIHSDIIGYWTKRPRDNDKFVKGMMDESDFVVPSDRGRQIGLLQLLTGSKQNFESKSKNISKDTYTLLNAIHSYRNRNQHGDGQKVHLGVAVAAIMSCIELLACLERELAT